MHGLTVGPSLQKPKRRAASDWSNAKGNRGEIFGISSRTLLIWVPRCPLGICSDLCMFGLFSVARGLLLHTPCSRGWLDHSHSAGPASAAATALLTYTCQGIILTSTTRKNLDLCVPVVCVSYLLATVQTTMRLACKCYWSKKKKKSTQYDCRYAQEPHNQNKRENLSLQQQPCIDLQDWTILSASSPLGIHAGLGQNQNPTLGAKETKDLLVMRAIDLHRQVATSR